MRAVYAFRCGYCGVTEAQVGSELTFDHFRPQSRGGPDDVANLVYACHACNEFKGEYWAESDNTRLLHPLTDDLTQHIVEEKNSTLRPLTALGQVYLDRLQLIPGTRLGPGDPREPQRQNPQHLGAGRECRLPAKLIP